MEDVKPPKHRPNAEEKRALKRAAVIEFVHEAGRKTRRNADPNDRQVDRDVVRELKQMSPEELDRLLRGED